MATNNDILRKHKLVIDNHTYGYERVDVYDMLDEARADEKRMIIDAIWNWWNTKPQHLL